MTFPSAACQTCKERRIKCDETKPVCQRCVKSRRVCRGMRARKAWSIIHIENSYASGREKRPRGPRTIQEVPPKLPNCLDTVLHRPFIDLKTKALLYFSQSQLQTIKGTFSILRGVTTDFIPLWESRVECPVFDLAVSSVALAVYSRTQQHTIAAIEGSTKYQQLLGILQMAIKSLDKKSVDLCLIAIFFMGRFEDIVHSPSYPTVEVHSSKKIQSFSHHDGALAILKHWKVNMSQTDPVTDIIKYTRRGMIRSAILRNLGLPRWLWEGSLFGECDESELEHDSIVVRLVNLRHRLSILLMSNANLWCVSDECTSKFEQLNNEARQLDTELQDWERRNLGSCRYQRHILPASHPWPAKYFYSSTVYSYSSPTYAPVWVLYYATRILIYSTLLRTIQPNYPKPNGKSHDRRSEYLFTMQSMADDLASSLPFSLQMFHVTEDKECFTQQSTITPSTDEGIKPYVANLIIWPLSIVANLSGLDAEHKLWFKSLLAQLGRIMGISVLESVETNPWPEL